MTERQILVVEDDQDLALLMRQSLSSAGYACHVAIDAPQAMTFARQFKPAVVIMDFMFPSGGGASVHAAFRASSYAAKTPILILSAVPEDAVIKKIDMDGDTYYLEKPFRKELLMKVLDQILS